VHRFVRESGYVSPSAEYEPFEVEVYVADDKSPRHKNGRFMTCHGYKMKVSKNGQ
jgi:hypothetical protein